MLFLESNFPNLENLQPFSFKSIPAVLTGIPVVAGGEAASSPVQFGHTDKRHERCFPALNISILRPMQPQLRPYIHSRKARAERGAVT